MSEGSSPRQKEQQGSRHQLRQSVHGHRVLVRLYPGLLGRSARPLCRESPERASRSLYPEAGAGGGLLDHRGNVGCIRDWQGVDR